MIALKVRPINDGVWPDCWAYVTKDAEAVVTEVVPRSCYLENQNVADLLKQIWLAENPRKDWIFEVEEVGEDSNV